MRILAVPDVISVWGGARGTVILKSDETVWTWGSGTHGELGQGAASTNYYPAQVPGLTNIVSISAGWFHILTVKSDGTAWAWGNNSNGGLSAGVSQVACS